MDFKKKIWGYRENQAVVRKTFGDLIEVFYHTFILSKKFLPSITNFLELQGALVWSALVVTTTTARQYLETADWVNFLWSFHQRPIIREY